MPALHELDKAIGSHTVWKLRLKAAVDSGRLDGPMTGLHSHDCPFSKWLSGPTIAPSTRQSPHYQRVAELHDRFHANAARVAKLAAEGQTDVAVEEITGAGEFSRAHKELAAALEGWKAAMR